MQTLQVLWNFIKIVLKISGLLFIVELLVEINTIFNDFSGDKDKSKKENK